MKPIRTDFIPEDFKDFRIKQTEFIKSAFKSEDFIQDELPQIVFAGKSNVGKSTIINSLLNRKSLAKTSSKPGKTRLVNYFLVNNNFYLVDLPGYGYAKVSKSEKVNWEKLIKRYLETNKHLYCAFSLVDIRHEPTAADINMIDLFCYHGVRQIVVLTKADKVSNNDIIKRLSSLKKKIGNKPIDLIVPHSSSSRLNHQQILDTINYLLSDLNVRIVI